MIELRTLGAVDVTDPSGDADVAAVRSRPKALALLVYLALASRDGPVRRDTLFGLFWPELSEERARRALSQTLYTLRSTLGADVFDGSGQEDLRVRSEALACDACAFLDALEEQRSPEALALYAGDFLKGFHLADCPEFDRWADGRRSELRRTAVRTALGLAREAAEAGDAMEVARSVRWALAHAPHDEGVLREGLRLLDRVGNRAAALDAYEAFAGRLREELELEPSGETEGLVAEMRAPAPHASGERPGLHREDGAAPSRDSPTRPAPGSDSGRGGDRRAREPGSGTGGRRQRAAVVAPGHRALPWLAAAVIVAAGTGLFLWQAGPGDAVRTSASPPADGSAIPALDDDRPRIAVLPLENLSADEENAYLAAGLHEELLRRLSLVRSLAVISRTSVLRYRDAEMGVREIADDLGVRYVVEGTVQEDGGRVRVQVQLIDAGADRHLWADRYDRGLEDLFQLQSEIAEAIAGELEVLITPGERARIEARPTEDPIAYDLYLRAVDLGYQIKEEYDASIRLLTRAIDRDPEFALAHARLAQWLFGGRTLHGYPPHDSALALARRAVALDPALAEAHAVEGWLLANVDRDYEGRAALQRAIALNPNLSLAWSGLTAVGHWSGDPVGGALAGRRGARVDPNDAIQALHLGVALLAVGMYDESAAWYERSLELDPGYVWAPQGLMLGAMSAGRMEVARKYASRMVRAAAESPMALYHASLFHVLDGDLEAAEASLLKIETSLQPEMNLQSSPSALALLAWVQARLGRSEGRARLEYVRTLRSGQLEERPRSRLVRSDLTLVASVLGEPEEQLHWFLETVQRDQTGFLYFMRDYPWLDGIRDRLEFRAWLRESEARLAAQQRELRTVGGWTPQEVLGGRAPEAGR